ncbi:MAG TPA: hypothetical protein VNC61_08420 [Acidimicrobiales bacterium]|nr:hypothetical protein [Acidimicrobiales bacterium]
MTAATSTLSIALCPEADNASEFDRITARQNATMVVLTAPTSTQDRPVAVIENRWIVADSSAHFGRMKAAISTCVGKTWTAASGQQETWASMTGLPKIGDGSISFLATAKVATKSGEVERYLPTTVARFANLAVMLQGLDDHDVGKAPTLTIGQLSTIFTEAATKIEHIAT